MMARMTRAPWPSLSLLPLLPLFVVATLARGAADDLLPAVECSPRSGLPNFFAKLTRSGADVRIAYLGGSITAQEG